MSLHYPYSTQKDQFPELKEPGNANQSFPTFPQSTDPSEELPVSQSDPQSPSTQNSHPFEISNEEWQKAQEIASLQYSKLVGSVEAAIEFLGYTMRDFADRVQIDERDAKNWLHNRLCSTEVNTAIRWWYAEFTIAKSRGQLKGFKEIVGEYRKKVKEYMSKDGLSQWDLSKQVHLPQGTISCWLTGSSYSKRSTRRFVRWIAAREQYGPNPEIHNSAEGEPEEINSSSSSSSSSSDDSESDYTSPHRSSAKKLTASHAKRKKRKKAKSTSKRKKSKKHINSSSDSFLSSSLSSSNSSSESTRKGRKKRKKHTKARSKRPLKTSTPSSKRIRT